MTPHTCVWLVPALVLALIACESPPPDAAIVNAPPDTMVLMATDSPRHPDRQTAEAVHDADAFFSRLDAALENGTWTMERHRRTPAGLVQVADTSATATDFGVVADEAGRVLGAVLGDPPYYTAFTTYAFAPNGQTSAVLRQYSDGENGCAEWVSVNLQWVIAAGRVIHHSRELRDQDDYDIDPEQCFVGASERLMVFRSWQALARSVGWRER